MFAQSDGVSLRVSIISCRAVTNEEVCHGVATKEEVRCVVHVPPARRRRVVMFSARPPDLHPVCGKRGERFLGSTQGRGRESPAPRVARAQPDSKCGVRGSREAGGRTPDGSQASRPTRSTAAAQLLRRRPQVIRAQSRTHHGQAPVRRSAISCHSSTHADCRALDLHCERRGHRFGSAQPVSGSRSPPTSRRLL